MPLTHLESSPRRAATVRVRRWGVTLLLGRILHAWGIGKAKQPSFGRVSGMILTQIALIGAIAASPAAAAIVPPDDKRLTTRTQDIAGYKAYVAEPRSRSLKPTVLAIHRPRAA